MEDSCFTCRTPTIEMHTHSYTQRHLPWAFQSLYTFQVIIHKSLTPLLLISHLLRPLCSQFPHWSSPILGLFATLRDHLTLKSLCIIQQDFAEYVVTCSIYHLAKPNQQPSYGDLYLTESPITPFYILH